MKKGFNWGCLVKILALAAVILVILFLYLSCSGGSCIQRIDKTEPDTTKAPYRITTATHLYYAHLAAENKDKSVTMTGWYERDGGKWVLHKDTINLPPVLRPKVEKRKNLSPENS